LLFPFLICGYVAIEDSNSSGLLYLALIYLAASILFYWLNSNRLFFQEYNIEMTDEQFKRAIKATAKELDWKITELKESSAVAVRRAEPFGSGGEKITIQKTGNKIFINSMGNPDLSRKVYSPKKNRENINAFLINAARILKGEEVEKIISKKTEGKCITDGFIKPNSVKIVNYSSGVINGDLVEFHTLFECMVCHPVEGMLIECQTKTITKASSFLNPNFINPSRRRTSRPVITTPATLFKPKSRFKATAEPITSATSVAIIAISARIHNRTAKGFLNTARQA
jgi:hypothetical protein